MNTMGTLIMKFFHVYLANERGLSAHTIHSYSDCVRLLLSFAGERLGLSVDKLSFDGISDSLILDFLDHLEAKRENAPATRNQRLAAIKTFFRFLAHHEPTLLATCERVCAIRAKNAPHKVMETMNNAEVQAIFDGLTADTVHDARDRALLSLLYNTGARVQEVVDLHIGDLRMDAPYHVKLTGKGRKERFVPLHKETVDDLRRHLNMRTEDGITSQALFLNDKHARLTRFGVSHIVKTRTHDAVARAPSLAGRKITPHTFRHTTALHMIQANVGIEVVCVMLGHASSRTTSLYVEIDLEMKRKALEAFPPPASPEATAETPNWRNPGILKFLHDLSRPVPLC
jgi:site-specific recombinase XerD